MYVKYTIYYALSLTIKHCNADKSFKIGFTYLRIWQLLGRCLTISMRQNTKSYVPPTIEPSLAKESLRMPRRFL